MIAIPPIGRALFGLLLLAVGFGAAASHQSPSDARVYLEPFDNFVNVPRFWQPQSGYWAVSNGRYIGERTDTSITTMYQYPQLDGSTSDTIYQDFDFETRMRLPTVAGSAVGLVLDFVDVTQYEKLIFNGDGRVELLYVSGGTVTPRGFGGGGGATGGWITVKVTKRGNRFSLLLNGSPSFQVPFARSVPNNQGAIGVIAHNMSAQVDYAVVSVPVGDQPFFEPFNAFIPSGWQLNAPTLGHWSVANGTLNSNTVQQTSFIATPIHAGMFSTPAFTLRGRVLNPYRSSGNLVGFAFNYRPNLGTYHEVVLSPTGVARVNFVANGIAQTLASTTYAGRPNVEMEVMIQVASHVDVAVDGRLLFSHVPATESGFPEGAVGLITHWAPGRFDEVQFSHGVTQPLSENFASGLPSATVVGTWNTNGGTLNGTSARQTDYVVLGCGCNPTDYIYRARLLNQYVASGNRVGLIYDFQAPGEPNAGDFYEVVFAPTGQAFINRVVGGETSLVASGQHNIGPNTWFDVELIRDSNNSTVKVNGVPIFMLEKVTTGQFGPGRVGVISHWARGRFDNLSVTPLLARDR
jgi:hypothetical protein